MVRLLTQDDHVKRDNVRRLIERIERREIALRITETAISDLVYVLKSGTYGLTRREIVELVRPILALPWGHRAPRTVTAVTGALSRSAHP